MKKLMGNPMKRLLQAFVATFFLVTPAFAAFNITVRPYSGGNDLRFDKGVPGNNEINQQVILDIRSDAGARYQVIQTLLEPLTNPQGTSIPQNNFYVYGAPGSNKSGTLSVQQELPVSLGRTIIYTSNPSGLSDSFNLLYILKYPLNVPSGSYRGRIAFSLEPIDSSGAPVTVIMNIFAEITGEAGIEINTVNISKIISLNSERPDANSSSVLFNVKGDMGNQFRISQILTSPLESREGPDLPYDAVVFQVSEIKKGAGPAQNIPLSSRKELIYTSDARGEADSFVVTYSLAEPEKQKAGSYRTTIKYSIENPTVTPLEGDFHLEVEIARVFDLVIAPELGGLIQFRDLKPKESAKRSEVVIQVNSNTGKQYQVSQQVLSGLVNKEGQAIPSGNFTLKEESVDTKGKLQFTSPEEVKNGQMTLLVSDKEGSSDKFKVIYELSPSLDIIAGDYSTRITYSISEI
jgi:hypothetical protein